MNLSVYFHNVKAFLSIHVPYLFVCVNNRSLHVSVTHRYLRYPEYHYLYLGENGTHAIDLFCQCGR